MSNPYASISIICVYNNLAVREQCLDRSIEALSGESDDVEYIPIDNVNSSYGSAGAALNHGVSLANNDVMVFVHQDVYLHSLLALKKAATRMQSENFGIIGSVGVSVGVNGRFVGRMRDRVFLLGERVDQLTEVDSLDEVLFMVPREQLLSEPLTESPDLAWHAYAVEYGLRMRRKGSHVGVADIPLTHNSLSLNTALLNVAHQTVARNYPEFLPVNTTCGRIDSVTAEGKNLAWRCRRLLDAIVTHWYYRWLRGSVVLQRSLKVTGEAVGVLVYLKREIDAVIERAPGKRIHVMNCVTEGPFAGDSLKPVELPRGGGTVTFSDRSVSDIPAAVANTPPSDWIIVTNVNDKDIQFLKSQMRLSSSVLGYHEATDRWLLLGPRLAELPESWQSRRATPLGPRAIVGSYMLQAAGTSCVTLAATIARRVS